MPSPMAKTAEAQIQERNLQYVAATRAKNHLVDVFNVKEEKNYTSLRA